MSILQVKMPVATIPQWGMKAVFREWIVAPRCRQSDQEMWDSRAVSSPSYLMSTQEVASGKHHWRMAQTTFVLPGWTSSHARVHSFLEKTCSIMGQKHGHPYRSTINAAGPLCPRTQHSELPLSQTRSFSPWRSLEGTSEVP